MVSPVMALERSLARNRASAADFELVDVALERSAVGGHLQHVAEGADAAGGKRLDGTGGDGVDADVLRTEVGSEVADA